MQKNITNIFVILLAALPATCMANKVIDLLKNRDYKGAEAAINKKTANEPDEKGRSPLMFIAGVKGYYQQDLKPVVTALIKAGADVNAANDNGETPLYWTAGDPTFFKISELLIENGADVNTTTKDGTTVLMFAATNRNMPLVRLLAKKKADLNAQDEEGFTALRHAVGEANANEVETLLKAGADANIADKSGNTPLIDAARLYPTSHLKPGLIKIIKLLIAKRADKDMQDKEGKSFNDYASENDDLKQFTSLTASTKRGKIYKKSTTY